MHTMRLLAAAVANNASWCDAVCRSHGHPGTFSPRLWTSTRHRVRFYPNAITLAPEASARDVLALAPPAQPFAVKDSFARLDLALAGFRVIAEGSWIARDGLPGRPADSQSWDEVTSPAALTSWQAAWAGGGSIDGPVFLPDLLGDPRCTVLACRRGKAIIAGAIVYAADGAAGISNLFTAGLPPERLWGGVQLAVAELHPRLPIVGYEDGASLEAARQAGFNALGALRIWESSGRYPANISPFPRAVSGGQAYYRE